MSGYTYVIRDKDTGNYYGPKGRWSPYPSHGLSFSGAKRRVATLLNYAPAASNNPLFSHHYFPQKLEILKFPLINGIVVSSFEWDNGAAKEV